MITKMMNETHTVLFRQAPCDECGAIGSHGRDSRWTPANEELQWNIFSELQYSQLPRYK